MTQTRRLIYACIGLWAVMMWGSISDRAARGADAPADTTAADKAEASKEHAEKPHGDTHAAPHGKGGDHHDPYDLAEGNASPKLTKPDDLRFDLAIYTAVVFFLLLGLLGKFAWNPICKALEDREHAIAAKIEEARVGAERISEQLKQYEAKLAAASDEARELTAQARRDGELLREQIVGEAKATAQRERDRAVADISTARDVALKDIAQRSVDTAILLASNIVRRELRPQDHQVLVREVLEQLPSQN